MAADARTRELLSGALAHVTRRPEVHYAEVRWAKELSERLRVRNGAPDGMTRGGRAGFSVRLIARGTWGFSCTQTATPEALEKCANQALATALASSVLVKKPVVFPARAAQVGSYETKLVQNPFDVSLETKLADLGAAEAELRAGGPPVQSAEAWMTWTENEKLLLTSEGSDIYQRFVYGGAGISVIAIGDDGRMQRRSYPGFPGSEMRQAGYESVDGKTLLSEATRIRAEVVELLFADPCPEGTRDIILGSNQLALQVHESCGHPTELDRALGEEISLAGGSFLQPSDLGKLRYGSPIVTITADSLAPGGLGTFGWDDEATPAGTRPLVQDGMFVDYLSSRETAAELGRESTGTVRAEAWNRIPMIRMVNVSLVPRSGRFEDLIADTEDGILFDTNQSWSIDDLRLNFQFSCEIAWEIKHGKRTRMFKNARYTGVTPEMWNSCDAICGPEDARIWGLAMCGKGDPIQVMGVSHEASPARFRKVQVGHS